MDYIFIENLGINAIIGTFPHERVQKQRIKIDLKLGCDLSLASQSDRLEDTVDYSRIEEDTINFVENSSFLLIERLAGAIIDFIFANNAAILEVKVIINKPKSTKFAKSLGVELCRQRNNGAF